MTPENILWQSQVAIENAGVLTMAGYGAMIAVMFWLFQFSPEGWRRIIYPVFTAWLVLAFGVILYTGISNGLRCGL